MPSLAITPQPFRPSNLSIPPSPHSPLSPLETTFSRPTPQATYPAPSRSISETETALHNSRLPAKPLPWLWQCHVCGQNYPLAVTRRCLDDGHNFCSGESQGSALTRRGHVKSKKSRKSRRGQACASDFDYVGWQAYGDWRRSELAGRAHAETVSKPLRKEPLELQLKKNCYLDCNYPSECRWGKLANSSVSEPARSSMLDTIMEDVVETPPASFEEILGLTPPDMIMDDDLEPDNLVTPTSPPSPADHSQSFWSSLLTSAKSRQQKSKDRHAVVDLQDLVAVYEAEAQHFTSNRDVFIVGQDDDMEITPVSPSLPVKSPFELSRPAKRASADGHPLVPSPLRLSKTPSTSSMNELALQQSRLGLGIVVLDHGKAKSDQPTTIRRPSTRLGPSLKRRRLCRGLNPDRHGNKDKGRGRRRTKKTEGSTGSAAFASTD